ncbi:DNA translocase FtsK [Patescibacteria group bacterium]|nr:MAG: DNA translocase FtsK [Patescibacteria group bacterium]
MGRRLAPVCSLPRTKKPPDFPAAFALAAAGEIKYHAAVMAKKRKKKEEEADAPEITVSPETQRGILVVFLCAAAVLAGLSYFGAAGPLGSWVDRMLTSLFGWDRLIFVGILLLLSYKAISPERFRLGMAGGIGFSLLVFCVNGLIQLVTMVAEPAAVPWMQGGGLVGLFLAYPLLSVLGTWGAGVVLLALLAASFLLTFNLTLRQMGFIGAPIRWIMALVGAKPGPAAPRVHVLDGGEPAEDESEEESEEEETEPEDEAERFKSRTVEVTVSKSEQEMPEPAPRKHRPMISVPLELLNARTTKPQSGDIHRIAERIRATLEQFGIPVEMGDVSVGPTVTQYTFKPQEGIKLTRITGLSNDLALALAAHPIRIEAPIPGKSLVGVEVPNQTVALVPLREVLEGREFRERTSPLTIGLGKDVAGKGWTAAIDKMPHLLVAGSTGSGKSVCLNTIIISLLYENGPDDLRFIMVDPKRVELTVYNGIPHLVTPVITDVPKTVNALKWSIGEMERRFDLLSKAGKRDIKGYNATAPEKLPYLVIIIDELADLMVAAAAEVEGSIVRIAQMARAVGIHLILATQRPSVDVITGLIKANVTTRIAFAVASLIDSRTILDTSGAEKLLGRGDMLFTNAELSKPKRIQGCFVSEDEIKKVTDYITDKYGRAEYTDGVTEKNAGGSTTIFGDSDADPLLEEARVTVVRAGKASASLLQRRLKVGYARAARLLDLLEEAGIIGPGDGAKPREILVTDVELSEGMTGGDDGEEVVDMASDVTKDDMGDDDDGDESDEKEEESTTAA